MPEIFFGRVRARPDGERDQRGVSGERRFVGRVATIDSRVDKVSRAFRVRAVMPNPDLVLPAGMFMHVERGP